MGDPAGTREERQLGMAVMGTARSKEEQGA